MSNNLLPQPCIQMGQFINVTSSDLIAKPELRFPEPISGYQEQISGYQEPISGRQDFHVMVPNDAVVGSVNMDVNQLLGKRKSLLQSVQNKRASPVPVQSSSVSPRTQYLPASFFSKNALVSCNKTVKQTASRKQTSQKPLPVKPQNESSQSVRVRMRESLAGALAMVQCQMEAPKLHCVNTSNPLAGHVGESVSAVSGVDVTVSNGSTALLTLGDPSPVEGTSVQTSDAKEVIVQDNVSYSDNVFSKDDILQGDDLSWALESDIEFTEICQNEISGAMSNAGSQEILKEKLLLDPQVLAFKIEAELFKLFGGVNKKYKEKGRSLLFNLKDRSNPKLREKVMYGEIAAERLCSMSAEELASKELAEWRQAKAEEMAQMVVLQDAEVDIRSLVRKTHKGEFQVEVEPVDSSSVEVSVGMSSLNWSRPKNNKRKTPSITKKIALKKELNGSDEAPINGVTIDDEMQAATGSLPPFVSLDEFMSSVDSESPSDSLSSDTEKRSCVSDDNDAEAGLVLRISPKESANIELGTSPVKAEGGEIVLSKPNTDLKAEITSSHVPDGERVWEGALQFSASSVSSVIGILKSGEKTTTKEWPMMLEIKGRVRLNAFEKFVRELPNSRSRAVMVVSFVCREECSKTEQEYISEVVESYAKDERVGYAEPATGVELYLCPTRGRTAEILTKLIPRNQLDFLKSLDDDGLIGVIVWRRPQFKKPPLSNNSHKTYHHEKASSLTTTLNTSRYSNMLQVNHDDGGDVPPGFGPLAMAQNDDDDLPEFNYFSNGDAVKNRTSRCESVRELIHKYGKSENQNVNHDDNDLLPEWQPQMNQSHGLNYVNDGLMVRQCNEWWSHQANGGGY